MFTMVSIQRLGHSFGLLGLLWFAASAISAQEPHKFPFRAVHYEVSATLGPADHSLTARVKVDLQAESSSRVAELELHPSLKVTRVEGIDGKPLAHERDADSPLLVKVTLPQLATPGQTVTLTLDYSGLLASEENSPIKGLRLAYIGEEGSYLLLPARWFPLAGYPASRFTALFKIEVPENISVAGTGEASPPRVVAVKAPAPPPGKAQPPAGAVSTSRVLYTFDAARSEAAGTFVAGNIQRIPGQAEGLTIPVYVPPAMASSAAAYGETVARVVQFFSAEFGPLPQPNLSVAEMPEGSPASYAAPGLLLVSQRQWDPKVNYRLLARLAANEWWGNSVFPASASDVWLSDGLARYSEALYVEHEAGREGFKRALEEFAVGALMYEDAAPIAQAARLEPFTSEYRSVVVNKGAMVFHMLRGQLGDETFRALLHDFYTKFSGKPARLEDFEALAQEKAGHKALAPGEPAPNLMPFFSQWLNSTGVPEFKVEYVVYRTAQKGFKIVGKVMQDLETFRMPVEVKVETEGNPEVKTIEVVGSNSEFSIETFGRPKPNGLLLDPDNNILKSSPRLRVRASVARGEELAEAGKYYDAIQQYQRALDVQKNNSLAHFRLGEAAFYQKNYQAAANSFRDALDGDLDPGYKWVEVWSHIYLGKIFDLTGQRERAVNEYSKAKNTNDDTGGAQAQVDRYLAQPYKSESTSGNP